MTPEKPIRLKGSRSLMSFNPRDLQKMQQQMLKAQEKMAEDLANMTIEGSAGGGAVVITLSGDQQAKSVKIDPEAVDPEDVGTLEDLVLTALNDAIEKALAAQQEAQQRMLASATGGLKLPPGLGF